MSVLIYIIIIAMYWLSYYYLTPMIYVAFEKKIREKNTFIIFFTKYLVNFIASFCMMLYFLQEIGWIVTIIDVSIISIIFYILELAEMTFLKNIENKYVTRRMFLIKTVLLIIIINAILKHIFV